MICYEVIALFL